MYDKRLASDIKILLEDNASKYFKLKDISKALQVRKHKHKDLRDTLFGLVKDQEIRLIGKSYTSNKKPKKEYLIGKFDARSLAKGKSFAFVIGEDKDVFISSEDTLNAYDGDIVKVEVRSGKRDRKYGIIVKVIERNRGNFIGTIVDYRGKKYLQPDNSRIHTVININKLNNALPGDKVVLEITNWGNRFKNIVPTGDVKENLGKAGNPEVEILSVIKHYDLPLEFPKKIQTEAENISDVINEDEIAKRKDFRDLITFTIDPESARDYDDAISFEKTDKGWELYVHIADVSHYVHTSSALFAEAFERGNSYYFPKLVIPMLPARISNNICSLRQDEDKLVMTVKTIYDKGFNIISQDIFNAIICSDRRFSYEEIDDYFAGNNNGIDPDLTIRLDNLLIFSKALNEKRKKKGYLHFELPETEYIFDEDGHIIDLKRSQETDSHKMIENCMLVANEFTAKLLSSHNTLYRIHEKPKEQSLIRLSETLSRCNIKFSVGKNLNKSIQKLLDSLPSKEYHRVFDKIILRSMQKARYDVINKGHFGLALKNYTHFTSPIRRLCDLVIHHQLKDIIMMREPSFDKKSLIQFANQASEKEIIADDSEREVDMKNKQLFMKKHIGEEFEGIILGMKNDGLIVELDRYPVTGLMEFATVPNEYFSFNQDMMLVTAKSCGKKYHLTDKIKVFVNRVDNDVYFGLVTENENL
jgi:ribonuclease R